MLRGILSLLFVAECIRVHSELPPFLPNNSTPVSPRSTGDPQPDNKVVGFAKRQVQQQSSFNFPSSIPTIEPRTSTGSQQGVLILANDPIPIVKEECSRDEDEVTLRFDLTTADKSSEDISWNIRLLDDCEPTTSTAKTTTSFASIKSGDASGYRKKTFYTHVYCLPKKDCFEFTIQDIDGLSDGSFYSLYFQDEIIKEIAGNYDFHQESFLVGTCTSMLQSTNINSNLKIPGEEYPKRSSPPPTLSSANAQDSGILIRSNATANSTTVECSDTEVLLRFELRTGYYPDHTSWSIRNLNTCEDFISDDASKYDITTLYNRTYCLQKEDCYEFIINDYYKDGLIHEDGAFYSLFYQDDVIIEKGGNYAFSQESFLIGSKCNIPDASTASSLPPTCAPTLSPTFPIVECSFDNEVPLNFELTTDYYPEEISWSIHDFFIEDESFILLGNSSEYEKGTFYNHTYCLDKEGCYKFTLNDSDGDGLRGESSFSLFYQGEVIIENGGNYQSSDSFRRVSFLVGNNCPPTSSPTVVPSSSPTTIPTIVIPTIVIPSPRPCTDDEVALRFELTTDGNPNDLNWKLILKDDNYYYNDPFVDIEVDDDYLKYTLYIHTYCVHRDACFMFILQDTFGDGLTHGDKGSYSIYYHDEIVMEKGGQYRFHEESFLIGNCVSESPTISGPLFVSPSPTFMPTLSAFPTFPPTKGHSYVLSSSESRRRRRYPVTIKRPPMRHINEKLPSCIEHNSTGCIKHESSLLLPTPSWAGQIHSNPPTCSTDKRGRNRKCDQGIPMSKTLLDDDFSSIMAITDSGFLPSPSINLDGLDEIIRYTSAIAWGDMDGDDVIDIIVCNHMEEPNYIHYGSNDGSFSEAISLNDGNLTCTDMDIADIDSDGLLDIVIAGRNNMDKLLLNRGDRTFDQYILPTRKRTTRAVKSGDLNNDGWLDLVFGCDKHFDQILYNDGTGKFTKFFELETEFDIVRTHGVELGDINGDNHVDILIASGSGHHNYIWYNLGNGAFNLEYLPGLFDAKDEDTNAVSIGDINGDGLIDIVIANENKRSYVLFNKEDGSFGTVELPIFGIELATKDIALGDLNGNGFLDVILVNDNQDTYIIYYAGDDAFNNPVILPSSAVSVELVDTNKDGFLDVILGDFNGLNKVLLQNSGEYEFNGAAAVLPGGIENTFSAAVGDLSGEGFNDIVLVNYGEGNQILYGNQDGSFELMDRISDKNDDTNSVALGDLNNDGRLDIVLGNGRKEPNQLLLNIGNRAFRAIDLPSNYTDTFSTICLGDVNGDGLVDILVGSLDSPNELLLNRGRETFDIIPLSGGNTGTISTYFADVNSDGHLDIIVINDDTTPNHLLLNKGDGTFGEARHLGGPNGGESVATTGDIDGDGNVDLVFADEMGCHILLNSGNGTFNDFKTIPSEHEGTAVQLADVNADGNLDILFATAAGPNYILYNIGQGVFEDAIILPGGNLITRSLILSDIEKEAGSLNIIVINSDSESNQLIHFSECPNGGAKLHSKSRCFRCPLFMGRKLSPFGFEQSACEECLPDHIQDTSDGGELCSSEPCFLAQRPLGENECTSCKGGTYYNSKISRIEDDSKTWDEQRCVTCSPGYYTDESLIGIDSCSECLPGEFQSEYGGTSCDTCGEGEYQPDRAQDKCELCAVGGYCDAVDTCDGGFTPCPAGTYNDKEGKSNLETSCRPCRKGTFSAEIGATSRDICKKCPAGTYSDTEGQSECISCPKGSYQSKPGQSFCTECEDGWYADNEGFINCIKCPYRTNSTRGSTSCSFCADGFYLKDHTANAPAIFADPFDHCIECPTDGDCPTNTTMQTIGLPEMFWRDSRNTQQIYPCESSACKGMKTNEYKQVGEESDRLYCKDGYTGPLCEVCMDDSKYYNRGKELCINCPSLGQIVLQTFILVLVIFLVAAGISTVMNRFRSVTTFAANLSLQAKFKVSITFYQLLSALQDADGASSVYGVRLDESVRQWLKFVEYLTFDILKYLSVPIGCIGPVQSHLIINGVWPYIAVIAMTLGHWATSFIFEFTSKDSHNIQSLRDSIQSVVTTATEKIWTQLLYWTIFMFYFVLPTISNKIFDAIKCQAYKTDDYTDTTTSYLMVEPSVVCEDDNETYSVLRRTFWFFFVLWPMLTPILFVILLIMIRQAVRNRRINPLANACRFLWNDYTEAMMFWDILETIRKIFLSGYIMFIDRNEGSTKIFRLIIAVVVSTLYMGLLMYAQPYKRKDDLYLAFVSNYLLICCFVTGIILHLCEGGDETCREFVGMNLSSYSASVVVICLTIGMTVISILFLILVSSNRIKTPEVTISDDAPNLELPPNCTCHAYISYLPATGKAQTIALKLSIRQFLPGIEIVSSYDELGTEVTLEQHVSESAVFVIVYSNGYFQSERCQKELKEAVRIEKPVIIIYEGKERMFREMCDQCLTYCFPNQYPGDSTMRKAREHVFDNEPILWLSSDFDIFTAASLKLIYERILSHLPHYMDYPDKLPGLEVPGEARDPNQIKFNLKLLFSEANIGSRQIAEKVQSMLSKRNKNRTILISKLKLNSQGGNTSSSVSSGYLTAPENEDKSAEASNLGESSTPLLQVPITQQNEEGTVPFPILQRFLRCRKDSFKEIFLLYLNWRLLQSTKKMKEVGAIVMEVLDQDIKVIIIYEHDDMNTPSDYWEALLNQPYNNNNITAIPYFTNSVEYEYYCETSVKEIVNKSITLLNRDQRGSLRGSLLTV